MGLQTAFYIIGIIFMSLMIIMFIALLSAVLVIKAKLNKLHSMVDERVGQAQKVVDSVSYGLNFLRRLVKH